MNFRVTLPVLLLLAAAPAGFAQLDRRSRDEPEVILNHGGRYGFCDTMRWDATGKHLFAAGDDKEVTVWPVLLDDPKGPTLNTDRTSVQHLRWPSWRERRGGIKAIAVDPVGDKVVVGGFGMLPSAVAVLSRTRTTAAESVVLAYTWPRARTGKNADNFGTVTAVAFDEAGERVAFGTADGSVWVWSAEKLAKPLPVEGKDAAEREWATPRRAGRHTPAGANPLDALAASRLLFFRGKGELVSVSRTGEGLAWDVSGGLSDDPAAAVPQPTGKLFHLGDKKNPHKQAVYRAELTPDRKGVAVAFEASPLVGVYDLTGQGAEVNLGDDRMAWGVAVEPGSGRLAVAVGGARAGANGQPRFFLERENEVRVYDAVTANAKPTVLPVGGRAEAVAFHPTRKGLVAVAGGDADEVRLFDLTREEREAKGPASTAVGVGRRVFAVGIVSDTEVAVKVLPDPAATHPNADARGPWITYDLSKQKTVVRGKEPSAARNEADGWAVRPDDGKNPQRHHWYAVGPDKRRALLKFNHAQYNDPTCYTFIPAGGNAPTRLLVGHTYGCSLYELPAPGKDVPAELLPAAVYVGHQAQVLSVAASADGTWFVTGGADHTVSAFTLKAWAHHPHLGAAFAPTPGKAEVVVTDVAVGSPAWEAGLVKGEKLTRVGVFGRGQYLNTVKDEDWPLMNTPQAAVTAAEVLAGRLLPGQQVYLETDGKEGDRLRLTSLQQRPVWKWFPAFANRPADATAPPDEVSDSVVWMWKGSKYMSAAAQGDLLAGWHVNPGKVFGSPYYYPLLDRNKRYSDPDLIRQLLRTRDVPAALATAWGKNPTPHALSFTLHEPVPLKLALPKLEVRKGQAAVRVTLDLSDLTGNPDTLPTELEVWVNDYRKERMPVALAKDKPFTAEILVDVSELRAGDNSITAIARNRAGGRVRNAGLLTNLNPAPANPRLVGWAGGINKYPGANAKLPPNVREVYGDLNELRFAVPDAEEVTNRFRVNTGDGRLYRQNDLQLKLDHDAHKASLTDELNRLVGLSKAGKLGPDDTLVLFLAGHGVLIGDHMVNGTTMVPRGEKEPEKVYGNIRFAFCGTDFDPLKPTATGVAADELFDLLVRINCRKLVFLDVCHAGGAVEADIIRQMLPEGQGPFVFAACGWGELAKEDPADKHGLFTRALLEATGDGFTRADADRSGDLSCKELAEYCTRRVQAIRLTAMRAANKDATRSDQNPEHNLETTALGRVVVFRKPPR